MRKLVYLVPVVLAACAAAPAAPVVHGETPGHRCDATGTEEFIGQTGTSETGAAIMRKTRSAVLRWAPPGYALTMDYRSDRVTVRLGPDSRITALNCG